MKSYTVRDYIEKADFEQHRFLDAADIRKQAFRILNDELTRAALEVKKAYPSNVFDLHDYEEYLVEELLKQFKPVGNKKESGNNERY